MNNFDDSGCPTGRNDGAKQIMQYTLKDQGMPQDQIAKLTDPNTMNQPLFGEHSAMRGKENGKPANIYSILCLVPIRTHQARSGQRKASASISTAKDGPLNYTDPLTSGDQGEDRQCGGPGLRLL